MSWVVLDGAVGTAGLATAVVMTFDDGMFVVIGVGLFLAAVIVCWLFSADAPPQVGGMLHLAMFAVVVRAVTAPCLHKLASDVCRWFR